MDTLFTGLIFVGMLLAVFMYLFIGAILCDLLKVDCAIGWFILFWPIGLFCVIPIRLAENFLAKIRIHKFIKKFKAGAFDRFIKEEE